MAAGLPAVDAELVLHAEYVGVGEIEVVSGQAVGIDILFRDLETHARRIAVAFAAVVRCDRVAVGGRNRSAHGFA